MPRTVTLEAVHTATEQTEAQPLEVGIEPNCIPEVGTTEERGVIIANGQEVLGAILKDRFTHLLGASVLIDEIGHKDPETGKYVPNRLEERTVNRMVAGDSDVTINGHQLVSQDAGISISEGIRWSFPEAQQGAAVAEHDLVIDSCWVREEEKDGSSYDVIRKVLLVQPIGAEVKDLSTEDTAAEPDMKRRILVRELWRKRSEDDFKTCDDDGNPLKNIKISQVAEAVYSEEDEGFEDALEEILMFWGGEIKWRTRGKIRIEELREYAKILFQAQKEYLTDPGETVVLQD